jgi:hypothetical protein
MLPTDVTVRCPEIYGGTLPGPSALCSFGFEYLLQIYEPGCMHVVATFKIPDILQDQPRGMHISEIAKRSGIEQGKLGRILRLLASKHIFREGIYLLSGKISMSEVIIGNQLHQTYSRTIASVYSCSPPTR